MWGFESVFGGRNKAASKGAGTASQFEAERLAREALQKAAHKDDGAFPVLDRDDAGFPDTEQMPTAVGTPVRSNETSRRSLAPEAAAVTPVAPTGSGMGDSRISQRDLEANLADPKLPRPVLPNLPQVSDPIAPNRWGADHARPPKTAYEATPVSGRGIEDLRVDARSLEESLADPEFARGSEAVLPADGYNKTRSRDRLAPRPTVAPLQMPGAELNQASDELNDPKRRREDEWRSAQAIARSGQGEGLAGLRTRPATPDERWKQAQEGMRVVERGSKHPDGLGAFRTEAKDPFKAEKPVLTPERKRELKANAEKLILDLRQMIDTEADPSSRKQMEARLRMAETFYDQEFK